MKESAKNYEIKEEEMQNVSGGIECDEEYKTARVCSCPMCGNTPAYVKGYYKSGQYGFVTDHFDAPLCKKCATKEANRRYPEMQLKELYYDEELYPGHEEP